MHHKIILFLIFNICELVLGGTNNGIPFSNDTMCSFISGCVFKAIKNNSSTNGAEICKTDCTSHLPALTDPSRPLGFTVEVTSFMFIPSEEPIRSAAYPSFNVSVKITDQDIDKVTLHLQQLGGPPYDLCYTHFITSSTRPLWTFNDCLICLDFDGIVDYVLMVEATSGVAAYLVHVPYSQNAMDIWQQKQPCSWRPTLCVGLAALPGGKVEVQLDAPPESVDVSFTLLRDQEPVQQITLTIASYSHFSFTNVPPGEYKLKANSSCFTLTTLHFTVVYPDTDVTFVWPLIIALLLSLLGVSLIITFRKIFFSIRGNDKRILLFYDDDSLSVAQTNEAQRLAKRFGVELVLLTEVILRNSSKKSPEMTTREYLASKTIDAYAVLYGEHSSKKIAKINDSGIFVDLFSMTFSLLKDYENRKTFILYFDMQKPSENALQIGKLESFNIPNEFLRFIARVRGDPFYCFKPCLKTWRDLGKMNWFFPIKAKNQDVKPSKIPNENTFV